MTAILAMYSIGTSDVNASSSAQAAPSESTNTNQLGTDTNVHTSGFDSNDVRMKNADGSANENDVSSGSNQKGKQSGATGNTASQLETEGARNKMMNGSSGDSGGGTSVNGKSEKEHANVSSGEASKPAAPQPPPPLLKGTLSYNVLARRHILRGMWNYESSSEFPAQRFELIRNLGSEEDPTILPKDGEFHGSFSLAYYHTSSKGKRKERSKVIQENGVKIVFKKKDVNDNVYEVNGEGTNQFGVFQIVGTATKSASDDDPSYNVELRKKYKSTQPAPTPDSGAPKKSKSKKRKLVSVSGDNGIDFISPDDDSGPFPPPSISYPSNVVCLRGKIVRDASDQNGVVHKISGMWSSGLDLVEADPQNIRGLCNRFEYEHRCTVPTEIFPLSGRYTGWFNLTNDDKSRTRISERDVILKFRKNNAGFFNVEGRGSNAFGKYNISGTLTKENIITIFRHFQPRKPKKTPLPVVVPTAAAPNMPSGSERVNGSSVLTQATQKSEGPPLMTLDDVIIPDEDPINPITPPVYGQYTAVSRGVLRINDDGAHTCTGKWAITREHFNATQTSNFHFGLEAHHATLAAEAMKEKEVGNDEKSDMTDVAEITDSTAVSTVTPTTLGSTTFPVDSAQYKGSFKMKRGTSKSNQSIVDKQIVLKFRKSSAGSYNVYGKGVNSIGIFTLVGTLILHGRGSGHVELYRIYAPAQATETPTVETIPTTISHPPRQGKALPLARNAQPVPKTVESEEPTSQPAGVVDMTTSQVPSLTAFPVQPALMTRRESSRQTKLPSRLEDDDPQAKIARMMEKCNGILKFIREKDTASGSFFAEPVDPVAHGIPTYHQVITNPMDLGTIQAKMDANEIESPEDFFRLVRLVFQNAVKFNVDSSHAVNQTARNLLAIFNQKVRDVERMTESLNKERKPTKAELKDMKRKQKEEKEKKRLEDKKRRRENSTTEDPRQAKLNQLQTSTEENAKILEALTTAVSTAINPNENVSRNEFNLMVQSLQHMQRQIGHIQSLITNLAPTETQTSKIPSMSSTAQDVSASTAVAPPKTNENKPKKKKAKKMVEKTPAVVPEPQPPVAAPEPAPEPVPPPVEEEPLTLEEQQELTESINGMSQDKLLTIIDIIRETAALNEDEEEIDLEIDQLDTATQRKLQRFVNKNTRKSKGGKKSGRKQANEAPAPAAPVPLKPASPAESQPSPQTKAKSSAPGDSFFAFGTKSDDSDSDSDSDSDGNGAPGKDMDGIKTEQNTSSKSGTFNIDDENGGGFGMNSMQDDDDDGIVDGNIAFNWKMSKPEASEPDKNDESADGDDAWAAARGQLAAQKALDKERQAREKKAKAEADAAKEKQFAEAAALGKKMQAERKEKEAEEARQRELKEKEERERAQKARMEAMKNLNSIQPTVDLDAQREIMREYEQSFYDKDLGGGASPSSDFGF